MQNVTENTAPHFYCLSLLCKVFGFYFCGRWILVSAFVLGVVIASGKFKFQNAVLCTTAQGSWY